MAHNAELFDALHRIESLDRDAYEVVRRWVDENARHVESLECKARSNRICIEEVEQELAGIRRNVGYIASYAKKCEGLFKPAIDEIVSIANRDAIEDESDAVRDHFSQFTIIA